MPTAPVDGTRVLSSGFVRPVEGPVSSRYGPRFHPILQVWKLHTGTDIGAACGTPVKAVKDGVVSFAGAAGGDGNRVVVEHGQGLATTYNHLSSYAAVGGMPVRQGQIIGYVGTTGLSTGCHLHFEVMVTGSSSTPGRTWTWHPHRP
ncbi:MAG: M23 family metallopeptidase [Dermatophilaceae bacterium]